ncbi:MAG: hypothetical protein FWF46_00260 [Oscillospiraceae bacterium]|nr:hypothetical protein [Oscillospiraceae bacterium]
MENATKGLMIAGAVLIALVLVALGVFLVNQAQGMKGTVQGQFDDTTISIFNQKFEASEGTIQGPAVKTLLTNISQNNQQAINDGTEDAKGINLVYDNGTTIDGQTPKNTSPNAIIAIRAQINTGRSYLVSMSYKTSGPGSRLIDTITILPQ